MDRRHLQIRVLHKSESSDGSDVSHLTYADRVSMMWQLACDAWAFKGEPQNAESAFQRNVVRVIRKGS